MPNYILKQLYRGAKPGDVVELSEEEAATLLQLERIPDVKPVALKPIAMVEPEDEKEEETIVSKPKRRGRPKKSETAEEKE